MAAGSLDLMPARPPGDRDFDLEAAQACLVAVFRRKVLQDYPDAGATGEGRRRGWQRPLAEKIGISQAVISNLWAAKPSDVQLSSLLRLQRWIGLPLDNILGISRQLGETLSPPKTTRRPISGR